MSYGKAQLEVDKYYHIRGHARGTGWTEIIDAVNLLIDFKYDVGLIVLSPLHPMHNTLKQARSKPCAPVINIDGKPVYKGMESRTWQVFDMVFTSHKVQELKLGASGKPGAWFVEFDDVSCVEIPPPKETDK